MSLIGVIRSLNVAPTDGPPQYCVAEVEMFCTQFLATGRIPDRFSVGKSAGHQKAVPDTELSMANLEKDAEAIAFARTLDNVPWCDDYEKMISGVLYDPFVPELAEGRFRARKLVHKYNNYLPKDATRDSLTDEREVMLRQMFGAVGKQPFIEPPINVDYGCNIIVGDNFYSNFNLVILDVAMVKIGNRVMFGPNVSIYSATHETGVQSRRDGIEYGKSVTIGDDCWIGGSVTIVAGVFIGKGCTIGAGAVVTKDIPDWSVAVGSPAKVIKKVDPVPDI